MKKCVIVNKSGRKDLGQLEPLIQSLMGFAQGRMKFQEPPGLEFHSDNENSKNVLGKTAHYDPTNRKVAIYVDARHPKDILRSIAHELVHHTQNLRGDFAKIGDTGPGYAQKDPHLRGMEEEAYQTGNMCFRDWEDEHKRLQNESKRKNTTMSNLKEQITRAVKKKLQEEHTKELHVGLQPAAQWHAEPTGEGVDEGDEDTLSKEEVKPNPHGPESKEKHKPSKEMKEMRELEEAVRNAVNSFLEEAQVYEVNEEELNEAGGTGKDDYLSGGDLTLPGGVDPSYESHIPGLEDEIPGAGWQHTGDANFGEGPRTSRSLNPFTDDDYEEAQENATDVDTKSGGKFTRPMSIKGALTGQGLQTDEYTPINEEEDNDEEKDLKEWYGDQLFETLKRQWTK